MKKKRIETQQLVVLAILSAIIVVLQFVSGYIRIGAVSITLTLVPIVLGAALYGVGSGAFLGFVFGLVVFIQGMANLDGGFIQLLMQENAVATVLLCFGKAIAAGAASGAVYRLFTRKRLIAQIEDANGNVTHRILTPERRALAAVLAGAVAPITNTGIFVLGMAIFFKNTTLALAGTGTSAIAFLILVMAGTNFLLEFAINMVLAPTIQRVILISKKTLGIKA